MLKEIKRTGDGLVSIKTGHYKVNINELVIDENSENYGISDKETFVKNLQKTGLNLVSPVAKTNHEGDYTVVIGKDIIEAAKEAGYSKIDVILINSTNKQVEEGYDENISDKDVKEQINSVIGKTEEAQEEVVEENQQEISIEHLLSTIVYEDIKGLGKARIEKIVNWLNQRPEKSMLITEFTKRVQEIKGIGESLAKNISAVMTEAYSI